MLEREVRDLCGGRGGAQSADDAGAGHAAAVALIEAETIFGAYHALETFSQLVRFDFDAGAYTITGRVPLAIRDRPRFGWRELMLDTSRHFQPVAVLLKVVDYYVL